jgi:PAS domain S-box-containing protein
MISDVPVFDSNGVGPDAARVAQDITERKVPEDKLRQQWHHFDTVLSNTPDFAYTFSLEGRFTYVNRALLSLWQLSLDEALGKDFFDLQYPPALAARLQRQIQQVIATRQPVRDETAYTGADGTAGFYEYIFVPVFAPDHSVEAVAGSTRDITERKRAEAALQESEKRFSAAFAEAPVAMVLTTPAGELIEANKAYLNLLGYSREDLATRSSDDFTHPDDVPLTHAFGEAFRNGSQPAPIEKRYIRKDGQIAWVRASGAMRRDADGRPAQFIAIVEDITRRKDAEHALGVSEERLRQVFAQAPVAVCLMRGPDLVFELVNPRYQALFPTRDLRGKSLLEAIPEVSPEVVTILRGVLETRVPFAAEEFRVQLDRDEDGVVEDYWFNFVYHPLLELDGTVSAVVAVAVDVSSSVRARQELVRANRELEEFAYVASHDLHEPLRMINIYTQLLMRGLGGEVKDDLIEYGSRISSAVTRMQQLLKDLLNFSHVLLAEKETIAQAVADLNISMAHALEALRERIESENATVTVQTLPIVHAEQAEVAQVFQNFLSNALKYRKADESPVILVTSRREGDEWVVSVRDNGIGFEQKHATTVFGLFKRLHGDRYPGTGLGLAICQRLIDRYGGRVWAESAPGAGSNFSFSLRAILNVDDPSRELNARAE